VGVVPGRPVLGSLKVGGNVLDSDIRVAGDVGAVQALGFSGSRLFAGYTGDDQGVGTPTGAAIKAFTVTGIFRDSYVIASVLKNVLVRSVDTDDGGTEFGFRAKAAIGRLRVTNLGLVFDPVSQLPQRVDDFTAEVVP
jgi:hypothetical protein